MITATGFYGVLFDMASRWELELMLDFQPPKITEGANQSSLNDVCSQAAKLLS